jgi:hypothetical protein
MVDPRGSRIACINKRDSGCHGTLTAAMVAVSVSTGVMLPMQPSTTDSNGEPPRRAAGAHTDVSTQLQVTA